MFISFYNAIHIFKLYGLTINNEKKLELNIELKEILEQLSSDSNAVTKLTGIEKLINKNTYEVAVEAVNEAYEVS
ncbi:hypothetical protein [Bacillus cereus]|nr:hypothetical protein [Bacillus cereus]EOP00137.1 hypothetical protein II1_05214 [Bacillus cereus MC118]